MKKLVVPSFGGLCWTDRLKVELQTRTKGVFDEKWNAEFCTLSKCSIDGVGLLIAFVLALAVLKFYTVHQIGDGIIERVDEGKVDLGV